MAPTCYVVSVEEVPDEYDTAPKQGARIPGSQANRFSMDSDDEGDPMQTDSNAAGPSTFPPDHDSMDRERWEYPEESADEPPRARTPP